MATDTHTASRTAPSTVTQYLEKIRESKPLQGIIFGFILIGIGMALQVGALAGMMGIYGMTAIVVSTAAHLILAHLRRDS